MMNLEWAFVSFEAQRLTTARLALARITVCSLAAHHIRNVTAG